MVRTKNTIRSAPRADLAKRARYDEPLLPSPADVAQFADPMRDAYFVMRSITSLSLTNGWAFRKTAVLEAFERLQSMAPARGALADNLREFARQIAACETEQRARQARFAERSAELYLALREHRRSILAQSDSYEHCIDGDEEEEEDEEAEPKST